MAWLQADAQNIASGWAPPPQLHAPEIGGLVRGILENRQSQQENVQKNVAYAIKQWQEQQQSQAYLDAMQKAGVLPEGDYGALGVHGASDLAKQILAKKVADARMEHLLTKGVGGRGRRGGGGGDFGVPEVPEDYYGLSVAPGRHSPGPEIVEKDGVKYLVHRTSKSVTYSRVKDQGNLASQIKPTRTEQGWAAPEIPGLSVNINAPDEPAQTLQPDIAPAPDTAAAGPTPPPADQNLAPGYGTDATSMSSDDVRAAYRAGKMTREEAQARLKAMGFSD